MDSTFHESTGTHQISSPSKVINNMVGFTTDPRAARSSYHCNRATKKLNKWNFGPEQIGLTLSFYLVHIDLILASSSFWCWNVNQVRLQTNGFWIIYFLNLFDTFCVFQARMWPKWTMPLSFTSMLMMPGSQSSIAIHCSCCHIQFAVTSENPTGENPKKSIYIYIYMKYDFRTNGTKSIYRNGWEMSTSCVWTGRFWFSVIGIRFASTTTTWRAVSGGCCTLRFQLGSRISPDLPEGVAGGDWKPEFVWNNSYTKFFR